MYHILTNLHLVINYFSISLFNIWLSNGYTSFRWVIFLAWSCFKICVRNSTDVAAKKVPFGFSLKNFFLFCLTHFRPLFPDYHLFLRFTFEYLKNAVVWIWTHVLWYWKRLLCQLCHNQSSRRLRMYLLITID